MLNTHILKEDKRAIAFCDAFVNSKHQPKYIFGRNEYAKSIAAQVEVDGFIDDFTSDYFYIDKPILKTEDVPKDALVVSVVVGRPFTAKKRLEEAKLKQLDYFSFYRYAGLPIQQVTCWGDFKVDFASNKIQYKWVFDLLSDQESQKTFNAIINFRLSNNLSFMEGFVERQDSQYFEGFLELQGNGEVFVDVGGFDGSSSLGFIKNCPYYKEIHFFEPEKNNMSIAVEKLKSYHSINYYEIALSDNKGFVRFSINGSSSRFDNNGSIHIYTDKLDDTVSAPVSYIKMDIEGAEKNALMGAQNIIKTFHPRLAVCVYHLGDDFWRIPELLLSIREDYNIYLRHYTEGIAETVMYFVPRQS